MANIRLGGAYVDFFGRNIRFVNAARQNVAAIERQQRAIRQLQTQLRGFNRTVDVFTRRFSLLAGIGAGLLVRDIAQLGQTMATVEAITGASSREFELLTRQVEQLGRVTRFTTVQAAEGQVFLARAGFDVNSILLTLPGTLQLAQVGLIDVGRAADIATNIMLSFGAAADQTTRFVDVLANTSTSSNTNIVQLGDGLKLAGSLAGVLGLSIEQTAAAMGILSNAGLQATIAGTGLRQIFADLTRLSGPAEDALRELGLTASDVAINDTQDLVDAIETLTRAGATAEDIFAIFDVRAATAFVVLQQYIDSFKELEASNLAAAGSAAELARVQDDTLLGAFKRADSAFRGFFIRLDSLTGASVAAKNALDGIATTINGFTDSLAQNLPRITFLVRTLFLGLLTRRVLLPVATALRAVTLQFGYLRAATLGATIAVRALLRLTGFLLLIEAITVAIDFMSEFKRRIDQTGVSFTTAFGITALRVVEGLLDGLTRIPDAFQKTIRITLAVVYEGFLTLGDAAIEAFITGITGGGIEEASRQLFARLEAGAGRIQERVSNIFNDTEGLFPDDSFFNLFDFADLVNQAANFNLTDELAKAMGMSPEQIESINTAALTSLEKARNNLVTRWQELIEGAPIPEVPPAPEIPVPEVPDPQVYDRITSDVVRLTNAGRDLNRTFENFFENVLTQTTSLSDALQQLVADLRLVALRYLVIRPLLNSVFNPASFPGLFEAIPSRQAGGLASGLTLVGEGGPELVDFRTPARVYSNEDTRGLLGGGASITLAPTYNGTQNLEEVQAYNEQVLMPQIVDLVDMRLRQRMRRRA